MSNIMEPPEDFMVVVNFCAGEPVPPNTQINLPNATTTIFDREFALATVT